MAQPPRSFTEQEAALVLKRAAELQQLEQGADGRATTLAELESAAEEAGIDRALVRRAATEIRRSAPVESRDNAFLGGPTSLVLEAVVEGEVGSDAHEFFVAEIRRRTGEHGSHDVLGRTLTWATTPVVGQGVARSLTVVVTPRNGVTTIRIEEKLHTMAGAIFGGVLGGVGGGGSGFVVMPFILAGMPTLIPLGLAVWVGGIYGIVRRVYGRKVARRREQHAALLAELVAIAQEHVAPEAPGV